MAKNQSKRVSSFQLWLKQINKWPIQFSSIVLLIIIMIPLSLCVLVLIPYMILTINSTPTDVTWQKLLGDQVGTLITPLVEGTLFESGMSLQFQQEWFAIIIITVAALYTFINYYSDYMIRDLGEKLAKNLRSQIIKKYLSLSFSDATSIDAGLLSSMVGEDIREALQTFTRLISSLLKDGLTSIIFLWWLIILDAQLFILFLTVLIPAGIVLRVTAKVLKRLSQQGLKLESELLSGILERMRGWQTIQVHKAASFEIQNFNKINDKIYHVWRRATRAKTLGSPLVEWLGIIAGAFIIIAALRRTSDGALSSQVFTSFMVTVAFLSDKINRMSNQLNSTRKGTDALQRIYLFLNEKFEFKNIQLDKAKNNEKVKSIEFKNVSIANPKQEVLLSNFSKTFYKGTILAIIGPSGIGKSTFIRTLVGVQNPVSGNILINNKTVTEEIYQNISSDICFIPQDPFLFLGSIFENIVYPLKIELPTDKDLENAKKSLTLSQLDKDLFSDVKGLSGGEKQRLMFARIFYHKPGFIIIDEGTSALDLGNELKILDNLKEQLSQSITFVVAHRPTIKNYATDIMDFMELRHIQHSN